MQMKKKKKKKKKKNETSQIGTADHRSIFLLLQFFRAPSIYRLTASVSPFRGPRDDAIFRLTEARADVAAADWGDDEHSDEIVVIDVFVGAPSPRRSTPTPLVSVSLLVSLLPLLLLPLLLLHRSRYHHLLQQQQRQ